MTDARPTVILTGATGFVGMALRKALSIDFRVVGLTRSTADIRETFAEREDGDETEWRTCDLFSLLELESAVRAADFAIYLANSKLPTSRLVQGSVEDIDLIMADNFARAAQLCGVKHILYLGGIIPPQEQHPRVRINQLDEVEQTLRSRNTPVTALRAGLIVGPSGSSLRIMINLVRRLPVMLLPEWTLTQTQPISLEDVVRAVRMCLSAPTDFNGQYDIGGPEIMTFREMLERTARIFHKKVLMVNVPRTFPFLSKAWVTMLGGASHYFVGPLVETLRYPMVARANAVQTALVPGATSFTTALQNSLDENGQLHPNPRDSIRAIDDEAIRRARRVRSVQRLPLPPGWSARDATEEFYRWLPGALRPFLRCDINPWVTVRVCLRFPNCSLIEFTCAPKRSSDDRQLLYITGGLLALTKNNPKARIEFREIIERHCMLVAIHDYAPTLPWIIYRFTQALVHLWVMRWFGSHLGRLGKQPAPVAQGQSPAEVKGVRDR